MSSAFFPRDRSYAAAPSTHNVGISYGFSPEFVQTGGGAPVTGNWVPIRVDSSGRMAIAIDNVSFSGDISVVDSGTYTPNFTQIIGTGQTQIPQGVKSWAVSVVSGFAFINGVGPIGAYTNVNGGALGGGYLSTSAINVGGTGTVANPVNILISYET